MPFDIAFQTTKVRIDGHDSEGLLIFADDQLSAVIVRLDGEAHAPEQKGRWHLEAGFGPCDVRIAPPVFTTPDDAAGWVRQMLARKET